MKQKYPILKTNSSIIFIECTEMNWKKSYLNGLCSLIFLDNMGWFLGVIGTIHNDEYSIYIFTENVENGTPIIFNKILYYYWYKELRTHFSPILHNTSYKNVHFCIKLMG